MLSIQTILHPTDLSPRSEYALQLACSLARDHGARLIVLHVMGTHGRTGLSRVVMGSVAEEVSREALCPVLTVKNPFAQAAS